MSAFAQTSEDEVRSKIAAVRYPALPQQARIQGDVHLHLNAGGVTVLSGHPLLAQAAVESAKAIGAIDGKTDLDLTYHFIIVETVTNVPTPRTVKRGNALERAILRVFGRKTERVVIDYRCESIPPASEVKVAGAVMEVWVFMESLIAFSPITAAMRVA